MDITEQVIYNLIILIIYIFFLVSLCIDQDNLDCLPDNFKHNRLLFQEEILLVLVKCVNAACKRKHQAQKQLEQDIDEQIRILAQKIKQHLNRAAFYAFIQHHRLHGQDVDDQHRDQDGYDRDDDHGDNLKRIVFAAELFIEQPCEKADQHRYNGHKKAQRIANRPDHAADRRADHRPQDAERMMMRVLARRVFPQAFLLFFRPNLLGISKSRLPLHKEIIRE